MATQTATQGNLENAQRIAIATCKYTEQHSAPCVNLVTKVKLAKGEKQVTWPYVGNMDDAEDLTDGEDLVLTQDIGLSYTALTTAEVGIKVILTKKLVRQFNEDVFKVVGKQMGDSMARKKDKDVIALFASLNGSTALGADNKNMSVANTAACIATMQAVPIPTPFAIVHHPNAIYQYQKSVNITPMATYPMPHGYSEDLLKEWYWGRTVGPGQVPMFHDGNIAAISGTASGYGAILSKDAIVFISSVDYEVERETDASLRATELVITADYGCFEVRDTYGAPMRYELGAASTSA